MIKLKQVNKIYSSGANKVYGVKDINVNIADGEFVAITGPSGCGKSTLLNLIGGIDTSSEGTVMVNEQELHKLNDKELTKFRKEKIGFVFQFFNLIATLTAVENVELSLALRGIKGKAARTEAEHYLEIVDMVKLQDRFPSEMSGGQQQRIAIARALAKKAPVLLADEPTGNIDSKSGQEVVDALYHSAKKLNATVIMVTHDQSIAEKAERNVKLKDGQIISDNKQ